MKGNANLACGAPECAEAQLLSDDDSGRLCFSLRGIGGKLGSAETVLEMLAQLVEQNMEQLGRIQSPTQLDLPLFEVAARVLASLIGVDNFKAMSRCKRQ